MVGYVKSRRHAASDRRVIDRLTQHKQWMDFYEQHCGLSRDEASTKAMSHVLSGDKFPTADQSPPWKGE